MSGTYPEPDGLMTGGYAGSTASHKRARTEAQGGVVGRRADAVRASVEARHRGGMTVSEVRLALGLHHGQASSALSNLHRAGVLARLSEQRGRCHVYVLADYVDGRQTEEPGHIRHNVVEHVMTGPALTLDEQALLARIEREAGLGDVDPSALTLIEAGDLRTLLDLIHAATGSTPVGAP